MLKNCQKQLILENFDIQKLMKNAEKLPKTADFGECVCVFRKFWGFVFKLRESAGNRSQMVSGCVGNVCDALARVFGVQESF